jgi:hypothetical protein
MSAFPATQRPFLEFCAKLNVPSFVALDSLDLANVVYSLSDSMLEYHVKKLKCGKKWQIRLKGSIPYSIEFPAFIASSTVDGSLSNWNLVKKGCKRVNKILCCLDTKPSFDVCNVRDIPGFRGFFAESITVPGSSIELVECKKKHESFLVIRLATNLTRCADLFAPVTFGGRGRCSLGCDGPVNNFSVIIGDVNGNFVAQVTPSPNGSWTLPTPVPAGIYFVYYVCASDNTIIMAVQVDFVHLDGFQFPTVNLNCTGSCGI